MKMMDCAKFVLLSTTFFFIKGAGARVAPHRPASAAAAADARVTPHRPASAAESVADAGQAWAIIRLQLSQICRYKVKKKVRNIYTKQHIITKRNRI